MCAFLIFIPIFVDTFVGGSLPREVMSSVRTEGGHTPFRKDFSAVFERQLKEHEHPVILIDHDEARGTFTRRAVDFLATRITAVRNFRERGAKGWPGKYSFIKLR